jgi:hypothetical protein
MAFDAPSRETCVARRSRTNTPLQALVLMNDEQYVEASRNLATRMLTDGGDTTESRLTLGFRLVAARTPTNRELAVLTDVYNDHLLHYQQNGPEAEKLLKIGESPRPETINPTEHAAMTMVANLLMNLDEVITKE